MIIRRPSEGIPAGIVAHTQPIMPGTLDALGAKLIAWFDYRGANASPIDTLADNAHDFDLTSTLTNRPTVASNGIVFDATNDRLVAAAVADWKFCHDGTGCAVFIVLKPTATATQMVLSTNPQAGVGFFLDHVAGTGQAVRHVWQVFNAGGAIVNLTEPVPGMSVGSPHIVAFTYTEAATPKEATLRIDRAEVASADTSGAPNTGNPAAVLTLGGLAGTPTTFPLSDVIYEIVMCSTLTALELASVETYLSARWGTP